MDLAHTVNIAGGVEPEMFLFGVAALVLPVTLRPSNSGSRTQFLVTLIAGVVLVAGSFVLPRL